MTTLTPEQRQAIEQAGGKPVRIEDPDTHEVYVIIKEESLRRLRGVDYDEGNFLPSDAYVAVDEAFREGWYTPEMAEYDDYETRRQ